MLTATDYFDTANALLAEARRHDGNVRRGLRKLSAKYVLDAVEGLAANDNMAEGTSWRTSPPVAASLDEGRG
jgi:hypothetical protein